MSSVLLFFFVQFLFLDANRNKMDLYTFCFSRYAGTPITFIFQHGARIVYRRWLMLALNEKR